MGRKKEKITYVDDGRTIADMSGVSGGFRGEERPQWVPRSSLKAQLQTFFDAMKLMFRPMLVVIGAMAVIYFIIFVAFSLAA